ncbi:MAG: type II secretion system protein N [Rhodoferax sp.]|nr:type II secretion system protein N [Rhodoferax sp.]
MSLFVTSRWWPRLAALALAAAAVGSAVAWWLRLQPPQTGGAIATAVGSTPLPDSGTLALALGGRNTERAATETSAQVAPALESSRFVLLGVVGTSGGQGVETGAALVAVDGKPAKPVVVGALLGDGWSLQSVTARSAVLEREGRSITLELPPVAPTLPFNTPRADTTVPGGVMSAIAPMNKNSP